VGLIFASVLLLIQTGTQVMLKSSLCFVNGTLKQCAYCHKPFNGQAWRVSDNCYVCNEFCADGLEHSSTPEGRMRKLS